ncbi:unnamed protein product [Cuscuta campestris]|uniref:CTLH domain-containing protein n=1 Tax=Cuscuta campestris TaxID=132261 RepID=A0A484MVS7_9ASTE|nr:unnamed protein product [Cuscuta campestris]
MDLGMGMEMDRCFQELEPEMSAMNLSDGDPIAVLTELNHRLRNMNPPESHPKMKFVVERSLEAVGVLLNHRLRNMNPPESHPKMKFVVERSLEAVGVLLSKIERAYENLGFDTQLINQIIVYHFYREGLFYAARYYVKRAGVVPTELLKQFELGKCMLKLLKAMDVDTALNWVSANRERYDSGAKLELGLHKLKYAGLFAGSENLGDPTIVGYAKTHFGAWAKLNRDKCEKVCWEASSENGMPQWGVGSYPYGQVGW